MGHGQILVIGDNLEDQVSKFQRAEYAPASNPYFVEKDGMEFLRKWYMADAVHMLRYVDGSLHDEYAPQFWRPVAQGKQSYVPEGYTKVRLPVHESVTFSDWVKKKMQAPLA